MRQPNKMPDHVSGIPRFKPVEGERIENAVLSRAFAPLQFRIMREHGFTLPDAKQTISGRDLHAYANRRPGELEFQPT